MKDIQLWQLLRAENIDRVAEFAKNSDSAGQSEFWRIPLREDPLLLIPLLDELADLPLAQRFPFFGWLPRVLAHDNAQIRAAALRALAGASGYLAWRELIGHLDDADQEVRRAAVAALHTSCDADSTRWAHVLFHPNSDIRKEGFQHPCKAPGLYLVYMLDDPDCAERACQELEKTATSTVAVPLLREHARKGTIPASLARRLIWSLTWYGLVQCWEMRRPYLECQKIVAEAENSSADSYVPPDNLQPDLLDDVFDLFWDDEAAAETDAESGKLLRKDLFHKLFDYLIGGGGHSYWEDVCSSLIVTATMRGRWIPEAVDVCVLLHPRVLNWLWIPADLRRRAVRLLYKFGPQRRGAFAEDYLQDLVKFCPLCQRESGSLDLWVIGGIMQLYPSEPVKRLLEWFDEGQIVSAFLEDMEESVSLLSLEDRSDKGTRYLLDRICATRRPQKSFLYCLTIHTCTAEQLEFLDDLTPTEAIEVFVHAQRMTRKSGMSMSPKKTAAVAKRLATNIGPGIAVFLRELLLLKAPSESELGLRLLARLARIAPTKTTVKAIRELPTADLRRCLIVVAACAGFPYEVETQLALALHQHADKEVRVWAKKRLPTDYGPNGTAKKKSAGRISRIKSSVFEHIAKCGEWLLDDAVAPCLKAPRKGLCEALAGRPSPSTTKAAVCAALLACHDPIDMVDEQFSRFVGKGDAFVDELENLVVKHWLDEERLPLLARAWLYRWQGHRSALESHWKKLPDDLFVLLRFTQVWKSPLLRKRLWQAVDDVLAVWRWHDHDRFVKMAHDEFGNLLIDSLCADVGNIAAHMLVTHYESGVAQALLDEWKTRVKDLLVDLSKSVVRDLGRWIDASGLPDVTTTLRPKKPSIKSEVIAEIRACANLDQLEKWCCSANIGMAEEAALRLVELGEPGAARLAKLLRRKKRLPAATGLAATVSFWPAGAARRSMFDLVCDSAINNEIRFICGACLLEAEEKGTPGFADLLEQLIELACAEADPSWFRPEDWDRLLRAGASEDHLAMRLAPSPQPHAYTSAARALCRSTSLSDEDVRLTLRTFLDFGTSRLRDLRLAAAERLRQADDPYGFPLLLSQFAAGDTEHPGCSEAAGILKNAPDELIEATVTAFLMAGPNVAKENKLLILLNNARPRLMASEAVQEGYQRMLSDAQDMVFRQAAAKELKRSPARARKLRRVAETYAWGVRRGRELTGRMFGVEMITESLGYTRFGENKLYISPLPILRGDRYSREIVEGLLLHEIGHHIYHSGPDNQEVWQRGADDGLHELLNLVSDEHLERNLRAVDDDFGDRLKKLCAYGFQHSTKEFPVDNLLRGLRGQAFSVLTKSKLNPARKPGCVQVDSGRLLLQMEKIGMSFPRFMRALRMGLGNRHEDPKVAEGLALFKKNFRHSSMPDMLEIARQLREIFGAETHLLKTFSQDELLLPGEGDCLKHGEGISSDEVKREVRRVLEPGSRKKQPRGTGPPRELWINVNPDEHFQEITNVVPLQHDPAEHAVYANKIQRHARKLRRYLDDLGVSLVPQRFRVRGKSLDRTRLKSLLLKGDPRVLITREPVIHTDLFLGVVVDCSGSMQSGENMEKAKLFGALLAEATRNHPGVDLRVFGFTDIEIFDAGDARRPAVHALRADGGNNDAAGLWHAAQIAKASRRRAKLLVMISDGLPTECTVAALKGLANRLTRRWKICCAQVAVQPLEEICFPHYILLDENDLDTSVRRFGQTMAKLVKEAMCG